jgi:hypothetical protein
MLSNADNVAVNLNGFLQEITISTTTGTIPQKIGYVFLKSRSIIWLIFILKSRPLATNLCPVVLLTIHKNAHPHNVTLKLGKQFSVLRTIEKWIVGQDDHSRIPWLYRPAGAGKSAIAQTVAESTAKQKNLAASFFFFRSSPDRNTAYKL